MGDDEVLGLGVVGGWVLVCGFECGGEFGFVDCVLCVEGVGVLVVGEDVEDGVFGWCGVVDYGSVYGSVF